MPRIVYVMDPYCPWCFAGSETVQRLLRDYTDKVEFYLLPASMLTHEYAFAYSPCQEAKQLASLARIEQATGVHFGEGYRQTLKTEDEIWDSTLSCRALEAVRRVDASQLFAYAHALLQARFVDGCSLQDETVFLTLAKHFNLDMERFLTAYRSEEVAEAVVKNFTLVDDYAEVYPTLCYEDNGVKNRIEEGQGTYAEVAERLNALLVGAQPTEKSVPKRGGCSGGVCEL